MKESSFFQRTNSLSLSFSHNIISTQYFDYSVLLLQCLWRLMSLHLSPKSLLSFHFTVVSQTLQQNVLRLWQQEQTPLRRQTDVVLLLHSSVTFSWCFQITGAQALLQIKTTPLWHQIFLSVAVSFHVHLLFLYFWNCNDYAVVGRATFHLAKPHSGSLQTSVSTFISGNFNPEEIWSVTHPDSADTCASWSKSERNL